jgi:hypothetical protein
MPNTFSAAKFGNERSRTLAAMPASTPSSAGSGPLAASCSNPSRKPAWSRSDRQMRSCTAAASRRRSGVNAAVRAASAVRSCSSALVRSQSSNSGPMIMYSARKCGASVATANALAYSLRASRSRSPRSIPCRVPTAVENASMRGP